MQHLHSGTSIFPGGHRGSFFLLFCIVELGQDARAGDRSSECSLCCLWFFRFLANPVSAQIQWFAGLEMTLEAVWCADGCVKEPSNTFIAVYMQGPVWLTACVWLWIQVRMECNATMRGDGRVSFVFNWGWTGLGDTHASGLSWGGDTCDVSSCVRQEEIKSCSILGRNLRSVKQFLPWTPLMVYFRQVCSLLKERTMETQTRTRLDSASRLRPLGRCQEVNGEWGNHKGFLKAIKQFKSKSASKLLWMLAY